MNFSLVSFHRMGVTIFREIIPHCGDDDSTKKYPAEVKTELLGFITFHDTMKIHGIIENDCEDFISSWCAKANSVQHHKNKPLDFCAPTRNERPWRPRPSSRQKVTMGGHFPSCFTKYSQKSNEVCIYVALSNHMLWNFGGKNLNTEPASVDCADSFESRVDFFIIFNAKLYWLLR